MCLSRITMVDYIGEDAADEFEAVYWEICPKMLQEVDALILVRTSATSGLSMAIYKTEELAEKMFPSKPKILKQCPSSIKDMFQLKRPVGFYYVNELMNASKK